jgi:hypothetical protein
MVMTAAEAFRKYAVDGVSGSGPHQPSKDDIRRWGEMLESMLNTVGLGYETAAQINADLSQDANSLALVYGDSTAANNGLYRKIGVAGSGSWSRVGDLVGDIVPLTVTGGTGNAITATAPETPQLPSRKLYTLIPTANNTTATTIAVNGGAAVPIKTAFGSALPSGSLLSGVQHLLSFNVDHYRLIIGVPVDVSGIQADVIAKRDEAVAAAASATSAAALLANQTAQYDTVTLATAATIGAGVNAVRVSGQSTVGDGGDGLYKRVGADPGAVTKFQSANGVWFQFVVGSSNVVKPITGLIISNNVTTPNTKIDISPGSAQMANDATVGVLASGWSKTTGAFVAGNNNGALDTGAVAANKGYWLYMIRNPTTLAIDFLLSLSGTAPTMPGGFTQKRRLRPIFTDGSGNIRPCVWYASGYVEIKVTGPTVAANRALLNASLLDLSPFGVPLGVKVKVKLLVTATNAVDGGNPAFYGFITDPDLGAPSNVGQATFYKPAGLFFATVVEVWTDTSARVYTWSTSTNDVDNTVSLIWQGLSDPLDPFA